MTRVANRAEWLPTSVPLGAAATGLTALVAAGAATQRDARPLALFAVCLVAAALLPLTRAVSYWVVLVCFTALLRRLLSADVVLDPIAVLPTAVAGVLLARTWRRLSFPRGLAGTATRVLLIAIVGSAALSLAVSPLGAGYAAGQLLVGTLFGAVLAGGEQLQAVREAVFRTLLICGPIVGVYGLLQFFVLPSWDAAWMVETGLQGIGQPVARQVRVFATLESPGPAALVMGLWVLLAARELTRRTAGLRRRMFLLGCLPVVTLAVVLTAVRSVFVALGIALLVAVARGGVSAAHRLANTVLLLGAGLAILSVSKSFGATNSLLGQQRLSVSAGGQDVSLGARLSLLGQARGLLSQPLSSEMGLGYGGHFTGQNSAGALDNGYLDLGLRAGLIAFVALLAVVGSGLLRAVRWDASALPLVIYAAVSLAAGPYLVTNAASLLFMVLIAAGHASRTQQAGGRDLDTARGSTAQGPPSRGAQRRQQGSGLALSRG